MRELAALQGPAAFQEIETGSRDDVVTSDYGRARSREVLSPRRVFSLACVSAVSPACADLIKSVSQ